jgi:hypothetical protein
MKYTSIIFLLLYLSPFLSCATGAVRMDTQKDLVADSGELTRAELEKAAERLSLTVSGHFQKNPNTKGIFIAFLPTKNNTSDQISTNIFDNNFVNGLLKHQIYTIRIKDRNSSLKEIQFSQTGATANTLSAGELKAPNYFVKCDIDENIFRHSGRKVVEQIINVELREVETTVVIWSDKIIYRKKAAAQGGITW